MNISCSVYGHHLRFRVEEWDETDESVVYRVRNGRYDAFHEAPRASSVEELASIGVTALYLDGVTDIREEK